MKADFTEVNETRKTVRVEIPSGIVDAEIDRHARDYSRKARIPGFRPGKAPPRVIKQRFKEQILRDVAQDLIPQAVDEALREKGLEAVDDPDIRDVTVEEGQPLTFTASFDTLPPFEPGDYTALSLRRPSAAVDANAVEEALQRLRERAARYEPVEGRGVEDGDTVTVDLTRSEGTSESAAAHSRSPIDSHTDVNVELGAKANPPGFDEHLRGMQAGTTKSFSIQYPAEYAIAELAGQNVTYTVSVKTIKRRRLPELDDEFAKDLGAFATLDELRARVREDLEQQARLAAERGLRSALMKQLAKRVPYEVPASLVDRELDRRTEEFAHGLLAQKIDPRDAGVDWRAFRESQREAAVEAVAAALVIDEVARREALQPTDDEVEREVARYGERTGRTPAAVRAELDKQGGLGRVRAGVRREKAIDFLLARATIAQDS
jgi:trigger factor